MLYFSKYWQRGVIMRFAQVLGALILTAALAGALVPSKAQVSGRLQRAEEETRAGNLDSARAIYSEILEQYPDNYEALARRGVVLSLLGNEAGASADFERARRANLFLLDARVEKNPESTDLLSARARALSELGRHADAIVDAGRAAAIEPLSAETQFVLGNVLYRSGDAEAAIAAYDRAIQLDESKVEALIARATALVSTGDLRAAEKDYRLAEERIAAGYP